MVFFGRPLTVAGQRWNLTNFAAARQLESYRTQPPRCGLNSGDAHIVERGHADGSAANFALRFGLDRLSLDVPPDRRELAFGGLWLARDEVANLALSRGWQAQSDAKEVCGLVEVAGGAHRARPSLL
jgi:hypothetical protein